MSVLNELTFAAKKIGKEPDKRKREVECLVGGSVMVTFLTWGSDVMVTATSEALAGGDDNHHHCDRTYDGCHAAGVRGVRSSWFVIDGSRRSTSQRYACGFFPWR
jgi:hypothetical protein